MKCYELLPKRSVRAGIFEVLSALEECCVLEFGPEGTMHYAISSIKGENPPLFTTGMQEEDIIFGETERLKQAVLELDRVYAPRYLFVLSSAVSEIIGTDLSTLCRRWQKETKAKLIPLSHIPMGMDYSEGYRIAYQALAELLSQMEPPKEKEIPSFSVLGLTATDFNGSSEREELGRMGREYLGISQLQVLGWGCRLSQLIQAEFTLVLRREALPVAKVMEKKFGIPYFEGIPWGMQATRELVSSISRRLGRPLLEAWEREWNQAKEDQRLFQRLLYSRLKSPQAVVVADLDQGMAVSRFLREECGITVLAVICAHEGPETEGVLLCQTEEEQLQAIGDAYRAGARLLLANQVLCDYFQGEFTVLQIANPNLRTPDFYRYAPFWGLRGMSCFLQTLLRCLFEGDK